MLIADDHLLFARALEALLANEQEIVVVAHARNGAEAVSLVQEHRPDVVLMDIDMPVLDGIEATRQVRFSSPETQVVLVSASVDEESFSAARTVGAIDFVAKDRVGAELVTAIMRVAETGPVAVS